MEMTSRQRLVAALRGQEVDHTPWNPFLAYWWEHQPQEIQERGQVWFFKEIDADPPSQCASTATCPIGA